MPKPLRIAIRIVCGLLALAGVLLLAVWMLSRHVPRFYHDAMQVADPVAQREAAERMDRQALDLSSNVHHSGHWRMVFTADEINAWLAVVLPKKFPESLPPQFVDPRVGIEPNRLTLACRCREGIFDSVLALTVEPYVPQPGVLALRIRKARAGRCRCRCVWCLARSARRFRAAISRRIGGRPTATGCCRLPCRPPTTATARASASRPCRFATAKSRSRGARSGSERHVGQAPPCLTNPPDNPGLPLPRRGS